MNSITLPTDTVIARAYRTTAGKTRIVELLRSPGRKPRYTMRLDTGTTFPDIPIEEVRELYDEAAIKIGKRP